MRINTKWSCLLCDKSGTFGIGAAHIHTYWLDKRKEQEVSNYTTSAEIAGKLLGHLEEAGVRFPSVVLFADGSGHFVVFKQDDVLAHNVLLLYAPRVSFFKRGTTATNEVAFDFNSTALEGYTLVCRTCKYPLEEERVAK